MRNLEYREAVMIVGNFHTGSTFSAVSHETYCTMRYVMECSYLLRWPTSAHQIEIAHTEFQFTTPNSNWSHRIQIHRTKFKLLTPNSNSPHRFQIANTELKFTTPNSNCSHRIQIHHTNSNSPHQILIPILPDYSMNFDRKLILLYSNENFQL